ncbi:MAG: AbrB/MazE/SpoVT family DNA-binding domain-containing protein [Syntrophomonadaceae bacterium]|nr:AbrB/MazE/SpoVT family DNA-binding domain-containing protein [Syntrophomonadaceae bacterium]
MPIVKITSKGQVVIPAEFRKKYGLSAPCKAMITEEDGRLVISPFPINPVEGTRGILKPRTPLKEAHVRYKKEELSLESES